MSVNANPLLRITPSGIRKGEPHLGERLVGVFLSVGEALLQDSGRESDPNPAPSRASSCSNVVRRLALPKPALYRAARLCRGIGSPFVL